MKLGEYDFGNDENKTSQNIKRLKLYFYKHIWRGIKSIGSNKFWWELLRNTKIIEKKCFTVFNKIIQIFFMYTDLGVISVGWSLNTGEHYIGTPFYIIIHR